MRMSHLTQGCILLVNSNCLYSCQGITKSYQSVFLKIWPCMLLAPECIWIIKTAANGFRLKIGPECERSSFRRQELLSRRFQTFQHIEQSFRRRLKRGGVRGRSQHQAGRVNEQGRGNRRLCDITKGYIPELCLEKPSRVKRKKWTFLILRSWLARWILCGQTHTEAFLLPCIFILLLFCWRCSAIIWSFLNHSEMMLIYYLTKTVTYIFNTGHSFVLALKWTASHSQRVANAGFLISLPCCRSRSQTESTDSVRWSLTCVSELVVLEASARDLVAQVLHVFLHLKEIRQTLVSVSQASKDRNPHLHCSVWCVGGRYVRHKESACQVGVVSGEVSRWVHVRRTKKACCNLT